MLGLHRAASLVGVPLDVQHDRGKRAYEGGNSPLSVSLGRVAGGGGGLFLDLGGSRLLSSSLLAWANLLTLGGLSLFLLFRVGFLLQSALLASKIWYSSGAASRLAAIARMVEVAVRGESWWQARIWFHRCCAGSHLV